MKPKERYLAALAGEQPDEVPISLAIGPTNAQKWVGRSDWRGVLEAHRLVGSIPAYGHGHGLSPIFKPHWRKGWGETVQTRVVHGKRDFSLKYRQITTPLGTLTSQERVDYLEYSAGQTLEPLIKTRDDYEVYLAYLEEWASCAEIEEAEELAAMRDEIGDEGVWVWWTVLTFYQPFWVLRSVQDYLLDFYDAPDLMRDVMQTMQRLNQMYLEAFNQSHCQVLVCNCSGASSSLVGPAFFREWVLPELEWLSANVKPGKFIGFHTTGKMRDIMPVMMEANPHFVLRFESPRFGGDLSLREAKEKYGDRICLMGGYDPHIYTQGGLDEVRREAIRCIDEAAEGGGYILDNSDAVPEDTEMDVVRAMVETAREYGSYGEAGINS